MVDITSNIIDWLILKHTKSSQKTLDWLIKNRAKIYRLNQDTTKWTIKCANKVPKYVINVLQTGTKRITTEIV
jgi:iron-sulfur cluster repair protein YtfE (RIC family)